MSSFPGPGFRFHEVQDLLEAYAAHDYTFTDSPEAPGPALSAYLRIVSKDPQRAATSVQQLDDLLRTGLHSPEIDDDVALLPKIEPVAGRSVEDCLRIVRDHLVRRIGHPVPEAQPLPQNNWEYRERFPELSQFLGSYFHQDFFDEYTSHGEAVDDYLAGTSETDRNQLVRDIAELLALAATDRNLKEATSLLGMEVSPPTGVGIRQWLADVSGIVSRHTGDQ